MLLALKKPSQTGHRRESDARFAAEDWIQKYEETNPGDRNSRGDALDALSMLQLSRPISAPAMQLLQILVGMTQDIDWRYYDELIVWPSNETLMLLVNKKLRTIQLRLRELEDACLITFNDCERGHRFGRRDPESGRVVADQCFGIDLRPYAAQVPDLLDSKESHRQTLNATRSARKRAKQLHMRLYQMYCTIVDLAGNEEKWDCHARTLEAAGEHISDKYPSQEACQASLALLEPLRIELEAVLRKIYRRKAMGHSVSSNLDTPQGATSSTQYTTTDSESSKEESVVLSKDESGAGAGLETDEPVQKVSFERRDQKERPGSLLQEIDDCNVSSDASNSQNGKGVSPESAKDYLDTYKIGPRKLKRACPNVIATAELFTNGAHIPNTWDGIMKVAHLVLKEVGVASHAWDKAVKTMGIEAASTAAFVLYEKTALGYQGIGDPIKNPGGYLYYYINQAEKGHLPFVNSVYKLLPKHEQGDEERSLIGPANSFKFIAAAK